MDPTLMSGTRFESQFQICVYEHTILRIYISFFPTCFVGPMCTNHTPPRSSYFLFCHIQINNSLISTRKIILLTASIFFDGFTSTSLPDSLLYTLTNKIILKY